MKLHFLTRFIIPIILSSLAINTIYLDYVSLTKKESEVPVISLSKEPTPSPAKSPNPSEEIKHTSVKVIDSCYPYSCVDLIRQATASSLAKSSLTAPVISSGTREYYIPFGSGETKSDQYEDVSGLQASIDSTKYGSIKKVTFEVSLRIPTGNGKMYVQLFNVTDKHPVWFSEVSSDSSVSKLMVSSPITLDSGEKLYKVQAKTSMTYQSLIDQARVHILAE